MQSFGPLSRWFALGLGLMTFACARTPPKPEAKDDLGFAPIRQMAPPPKPPANASPTRPGDNSGDRYRPRSLAEYEQLAGRITGDVTAARGLRLKRMLELELLEDANFDHALETSRGGTLSPEQERAFAAQLTAFSFADIDELEAQKDSKTFSGVIGLYDPDTRKLFVRMSSKSNDLDQEEQMQATIAHEVEHALQHQHFGLVDFTKLLSSFTDWDRLRALKAVYEGDAELARVLYLAAYDDAETTIAQHSATLRMQSRLSDRIKHVGFNANVTETAPFLRETTMFPYEQGSVFLSTLYQSGGMELVNKVFAHPPVSTEQVLHPQKYLQGDPPVPVPPPAVPSGYKVVAQGRLGELGIDVLLEQCADAQLAHPAAEGWGGDAFTISQNAAGQLALSWNTVWDTEADAKEFAAATKVLRTCWKKAASKTKGWSISEHYGVRRHGAVVSITRGLSPEDESTALTAMNAHQPAKLRAVPPLGKISLGEDPYEESINKLLSEKEKRGELRGRHYEHTRMGIKIDLPEKLAATINTATGSIDVRTKEENGGRGSLLFIHTGGRSTDEILDGGPTSWTRVVFGQFDDWLRRLTRREKLKVKSNRRFDLPLGDGRLREWEIAGTDTRHVQVVFVPTCSGQGAYYFLLYWQEEADHVLLEKWMRAFRLLNGPDLPVCGELAD